MALRVALFVEGAQNVPPPRGDAPLLRIWGDILQRHLSLRTLQPIVPISKKHLVAMDPSIPPMSGAGEALDALIVRKLGAPPVFDAAIVAWDLVPAWNPRATYCRWQETLALYEGLARSKVLPKLWTAQADARLEELRARRKPSARHALPRIVPGMVLPLCMEPMFEALLVQDERAARRILGVQGKQIQGWPTGWADPQCIRPDQDVLNPAVLALKALRPAPAIARAVRGDMRTNKDGWGALFLEGLLNDPEATDISSHPICRRLRELAGD